MDYSKISPQLNLALEEQPDDDDRRLVVFVHATAEPAPEQRESLKQQGIDLPADQKIFTATLSPRQVKLLSDEHWVQAIRLSQTLRPKSERDE